jgi:hypothetical protein
LRPINILQFLPCGKNNYSRDSQKNIGCEKGDGTGRDESRQMVYREYRKNCEEKNKDEIGN